ncbi:type II secretion system protein GspE [Desulfonema ishimotonii]|uniref:Type II secretion system protein GspE n=1 Tax=Desulfonema ishimotonii TaxID=45657 RepID=A0A401FTV1_9BACT|nr:GspE/PulE family protein [Desulfonema ishimotonii]GBC60391.1 type II secretion system protein GspE [Desulfonema ishimotonii]
MAGEKIKKTAQRSGEHKRIGDILLEAGLITADQMKAALREQAVSGKRLGSVLIRLGFISEENMVGALSRQLGFPSVDLKKVTLSHEMAGMLPPDFIIRHQLVPVGWADNTLKVAMVNPLDRSAIGDIEFMIGTAVQPLVTSMSAMEQFLDKMRKDHPSLSATPDGVETGSPSEGRAPDSQEPAEAAANRIISKVLTDAVRSGATYVHVKPRQRDVMVRYRIDGVLQTAITFPAETWASFLERFKAMARMDIALTRHVQSGTATVRIGDRPANLMISVLPTLNGEKLVIRILGKGQKMRNPESLGMHPKDLSSYYALLARPSGILMVVGPSGSGTSTTLYTSLRFLRSEEKNIVTIEDPVEYEIPGINQVRVSVREGISFSAGLRSLVHQDPDVVMVSEIQDAETASLVFQAALRGRLMLSSLHINNAVSALAYLMTLDVRRHIVASSIAGIVAQRLVRRNCPHCLEKYIPEPRVLAGLNIDAMEVAKMHFFRGRGCVHCNHTGYSGQIGIYEILTVDHIIRELILRRASEREIFMAVRGKGMTTMEENGLYLVLNRITTLEEIVRVIPPDEIATRRKGAWEKYILSLFDDAIYLL